MLFQICCSSFLVAVCYFSIMEWLLHRYMMHGKLFGFKYPYVAHTTIHHHIFRSDHTYHLKDEKDRKKITMAWWNSLILVPLFCLPAIAYSVNTGLWSVTAIFVITGFTYYWIYESTHLFMHLPPLIKRRLIERFRIFYWLNGHHLLHHRYMKKNLNVVFPLADVLFGTLLLRSPVCFAQASGPAVPDVQPITLLLRQSE
jgi:hypothetical protein